MSKVTKLPRRFPLVRVRFNSPEAWPEADLRHKDIMTALSGKRLGFYLRHFHVNEDLTLTPLNRAYEWELGLLRAMGRKTFRLL